LELDFFGAERGTVNTDGLTSPPMSMAADSARLKPGIEDTGGSDGPVLKSCENRLLASESSSRRRILREAADVSLDFRR